MNEAREEAARLAYLAGVTPRPCGRFWTGLVWGVALSLPFWGMFYLIARAVA